MDRLRRTIRRWHCIDTHQHLIVDALAVVRTGAGRRLAAWMLYHHSALLAGATDPDVRFRDFHNHFLLAGDRCWGGAPRVAHQWHSRLREEILREEFRDAARSLGVLSHYVADMTQPLHTVSRDDEAIVHRAFEWSVNQSYEQLTERLRGAGFRCDIRLSPGPAWLGSLMINLAAHAHERCDALLRSYRFERATRNPVDGLHGRSRDIVVELLGLTIEALAAAVDRIGQDVESDMGAPLADCPIHRAWIGVCWRRPLSAARRLRHQWREVRDVDDAAAEYFATGKLVRRLPPEVDIKRRVLAIYQADNDRRRGVA